MADRTMEFDPGVVDEVPQDTVEQNEVQFPIIQWHYGDPKAKKFGAVMDHIGGWFMPEEMAPADDMTPYGWEKTSWTHANGDETDGFWRAEIEIAMIHQRRRWEVYDGTNRSVFAWTDYDKAREVGRASGRSHVLCLVKGLEEFGAFVLTLKGTSGMYFQGTRTVKGALQQFDATVMRAASEAIRKSGRKGVMPRRAFWLKVGAKRDAKGNAVFTEVGQGTDKSNLVMPVAIGLPAKPDQVDLNEVYVGKELLDRLTEIYQDTLEWKSAWDSIAPGSSDGTETEAEKPDTETATEDDLDAIDF